MQNKKTLFIHQKPHPAHKLWAETVNAEFIFHKNIKIKIKNIPYAELISDIITHFLNGIKLPNADVYLCEGFSPVHPAVFKKFFNKKSKIIGILADETFSILCSNVPRNAYKSDKIIWKFNSSYIDGGIAVSNFVKKDAEKFLKCQIKIVHPFIQDEVYEKLTNINPNLNSQRIVSVGYSELKNGMDILVDAFKQVKKEFKNSELYIIGKGHPKSFEEVNGIKVLGFVDSIVPYFESCSLFVLVGLGQAFPVATIESLRAGLPTIVSKYTGTKEVIEKLGNNFVREPNSEDIARGIMEYFSLREEEKKFLSEKAKELSKEFNSKECCEKFKNAFEELVNN